jgi:nucleotide-binding universal stress UspA family protein
LQAQAYLTTLHDRLQAEGITTHRDLAWGDPAEEIVATIQHHQIDLILLSAHERSAFARLVAGGVAEAVLHQADVPVVLLSPPIAAGQATGSPVSGI